MKLVSVHPSSRHPLATVVAAGVALAFAFGAALVTSVISAAPASAHAVLVGITPAANAQLTTAPTKVVVEFDEPVSTNFATVVVTSAAGVSVAKGKAAVLGAKVTQAIGPDLASGAYRIAYQVTSDDGHPVSGESRFTLKLGSSASPATPSSPPTSAATAPAVGPSALGAPAGQSSWLSRYGVPTAGAVGLLALGSGLLLSRRRRR
jgi:methionine-rich copper-binding protein CopC